jgi:uncharacterized protein (DUF1015 family)
VADVRPFRGLLYDEAKAGPAAALIAPPYDVISAEKQAALYERSPYNIVRVEYSTEPVEDRYARAAADLQAWREAGVLKRDAEPAFYLYEQQFSTGGRAYGRRTLFARVRLQPWADSVVLPHERTMAGPKADRLALLEATRTNVSPVYCLYDDAGGEVAALLEPAGPPALDASVDGDRHRLWRMTDTALCAKLAGLFAERQLFVADGHHRYETALAFRDTRKAAASAWSGEEPENFVLMGLTAANDPGLAVLPIHRLVRKRPLVASVPEALSGEFACRRLEAAEEPSAALAAAPGVAFVAAGLEPDMLWLLEARNLARTREVMPAEMPPEWKDLAVNVLQYAILQELFGLGHDELRAGEVEYTESADEALDAVARGEFEVAFLLKPTRIEEVFAVARTGQPMPQKSTFFYPKLGTGLVLNPLE